MLSGEAYVCRHFLAMVPRLGSRSRPADLINLQIKGVTGDNLGVFVQQVTTLSLGIIIALASCWRCAVNACFGLTTRIARVNVERFRMSACGVNALDRN